MYEEQILRILLDVGERGISVKKLAKHVYNHYCTLFSRPDFDEVYRSVQYYLSSRSRSAKSVVERAEKRGHYRLNFGKTAEVSQLMLQFSNERQQEEESEKPAPDLSLDLFADYLS